MSDEAKARRDPRVVALLVLLPLWLVASTVFGLFLWWRGERNKSEPEQVRFTTPVEVDRLADDMRKLVEIVGPRQVGSEAGAFGLTRAATMIEGSLGASNAGYRIEKVSGPETPGGSWPLLMVTLPGDARPPVWVMTAYDTADGRLAADSSAVASTLAVAQALAGDSPGRPVTFAFVPHLHEPGAPSSATFDLLSGRIRPAAVVLWVGSMAGSGDLQVSGSAAGWPHREAIVRHATPVDAAGDSDGRPFPSDPRVVRVAAKSPAGGEGETRQGVDPDAHAAATRALAELVRDLAAEP